MIRIFLITVAIIATSVMALWGYSELTWDNGWRNSEQIFRIEERVSAASEMANENILNLAGTSIKYKAEITAVGGEKLAVTRVQPLETFVYNLKKEDWAKSKIIKVDSNASEVFGWTCMKVECGEALKTGILVSENFSKRSDRDFEVGENLRIAGQGDFLIAGFFRNPKSKTHLPHDIIVPQSLSNLPWSDVNTGTYSGFSQKAWTYLYLPNADDVGHLLEMLGDLNEKRAQLRDPKLGRIDLVAVEVQSIHRFNTHSDDVTEPSKEHLILGAILASNGLFIFIIIEILGSKLLRTVSQSREIGVLQAQGFGLISLFRIGVWSSKKEVFVFLILATIFGLAGSLKATGLAEESIGVAALNVSVFPVVVSFIVIALVTILVSGVAFILVARSSTPMAKLSATDVQAPMRRFRKIVTIMLLAFCSAFIVFSLSYSNEVKYRSYVNLGFEPSEIFVANLWNNELATNNLISQFSSFPEVGSVTASSFYPFYNMPSEGKVTAKFANKESLEVETVIQSISESFFETYNISIRHVSGEWKDNWQFPSNTSENASVPLFVNEAFAEILFESFEEFESSYENVLIGNIYNQGRFINGRIVGVVTDFKFESFSDDVRPILMLPKNPRSTILSLKLSKDFAPKSNDNFQSIIRHETANVFSELVSLQSIMNDYSSNDRFASRAMIFVSLIMFCLAFNMTASMAGESAKEFRMHQALIRGMGSSKSRAVVDGLFFKSPVFILSLLFGSVLGIYGFYKIIDSIQQSLHTVIMNCIFIFAISAVVIMSVFVSKFLIQEKRSISSTLTG